MTVGVNLTIVPSWGFLLAIEFGYTTARWPLEAAAALAQAYFVFQTCSKCVPRACVWCGMGHGGACVGSVTCGVW
jgi:hypothetical protein